MLGSAVDFVKIIKQAALDAVNAAKPVEVCFGKVTSEKPLKILVEQKMTLGEKQLVLSRNVTTFTTEVTVDWKSENHSIPHNHDINLTDSNGDSVTGSTQNKDVPHIHEITGKKKITIHNELVVGDEVILVRQQGGQKYIVWDRIG